MKDLFIRARMIEDDEKRDLVIADGVIADADPIPGTEPDTAGWVLPGLADVHNHLSLASPAGDGQDADPDRAHPFLPIMLAHTGRAYLLAGDLGARACASVPPPAPDPMTMTS